MLPRTDIPAPHLRVVSSALKQPEPGLDACLDIPNQFSACELAAEMAMHFALALVQDQPLHHLSKAHHMIDRGCGQRFTLHELLCELRSLSWFDGTTALPPPSDPCLTKRRGLSLNSDNQLCLRTLFQSGVATPLGATSPSALLLADHGCIVSKSRTTPPPCSASMADWQIWCAQTSGAGLTCLKTDEEDLGTLRALSEHIHKIPAARPFYNAALASLGKGVALDQGLQSAPGLCASNWSGQRLLSLMAKAEKRATKFATWCAAQADRVTRPPVMGARFSVELSQIENPSPQRDETLKRASAELAYAAPNLLSWMTRANEEQRGVSSLVYSVFVPLTKPFSAPMLPSETAGHMVIAGALATLIKAVFDTEESATLKPVDQSPSAPELTEQLHQLCANYAISRIAGGGFYSAENHAELRQGQSIALLLLRDTLAADNRSATLSLTGLDNEEITLSAHPRATGRGAVTLHKNGETQDWPDTKRSERPNLTAVI